MAITYSRVLRVKRNEDAQNKIGEGHCIKRYEQQ